jgi:hypothetical protein
VHLITIVANAVRHCFVLVVPDDALNDGRILAPMDNDDDNDDDDDHDDNADDE